MLYFVIFLTVLVIAIILFVTTHPTFGVSPSKFDIEKYNLYTNFSNGKFSNQSPTNMKMNFSTIVSLMKDSITAKNDRKPKNPIP
ncbi:hypothetical protein V7111_26720, partial [Neobacillus niacini]